MSFKNLIASLPIMKASAYIHSIVNDPLQQFMFVVRIDDLDIGFQKVSGLNVDLNVVEYHEGCTNYAKKLAGKAKFGEVTCEKGLVPEDELGLLPVLSDVASDCTDRKTIYISILDRAGNVRMKYILHNAFISKWEAPDLDASSDEVAIEKATIQYDYFTYEVSTGNDKGSSVIWSPIDGEVSNS